MRLVKDQSELKVHLNYIGDLQLIVIVVAMVTATVHPLHKHFRYFYFTYSESERTENFGILLVCLSKRVIVEHTHI